MRLYDSYLDSIAYLGWPIAGRPSEIDPVGTGFLAEFDGATYLVTAAHVAREFVSCPFGIRINRAVDKHGQVDHMDSATWYFHPDDTVDVAVMPYEIPDWARGVFRQYTMKYVLTDFKRETKNIGPGDMAYVVGIFKMLPGAQRNNPTVLVGHIASMADGEDIQTFDWRLTDEERAKIKGAPPLVNIRGYLVQVHTMRQASGSPVFVRRSLRTILDTGTEKLNSSIHGSIWFLGIWHGAWTDDVSKMLSLAAGSVELGVGMGIVTPATKVIETFERLDLKKMREEMKARHRVVTPQASTKLTARIREGTLLTMLSTPPQPRTKRAKRRITKK